MKSVILASVIFILIVVLVSTSYFYMNSVTEDMLAILKKNEKFVAKNDWQTAENEIKQLHSLWEKNRTLMSVLTNHTIIDEIDYAISRTSTSVNLRESSNFYEEMRILELKIQDLKEHQEISVSNLF